MNVNVQKTETLIAVGYDSASSSQNLLDYMLESGFNLNSEPSKYGSEHSTEYKVTIKIESI